MFLHWVSNSHNPSEFTVINSSENNVVGVPTTSGGIVVNFNHVAYGNGVFVAVGNQPSINDPGIVFTSTNGIQWTQQNSNQLYDIGSIVYANGVFLATLRDKISDSVIYSTDGVGWQSANINSANSLGITSLNIAYANSKWISVVNTNPNSSFTSTDGVNWTAYTSNRGSFRYVFGAGNQFIGLGTNASSQWVPYTSTDGISWTERSLPAPAQQLSTGAWSGSNVVIASDVNGEPYYSSNGITWNQSPDGDGQHDNMVWTGVRFLSALDLDSTFSSENQGVNWILRTATPSIGGTITGISVGEDTVVAVGTNGLIATIAL